MTKLFTLGMALMLAGFYAAAQINILAQEKFNPQKPAVKYLPTEKPMPMPQKQIAGQDWWEPDTVYAVYGSGNEARYVYSYNSQGLRAIEIDQHKIGGLWENYGQNICTYDFNDNILSDLYQRWSGTEWDNSYRYTYTYDSNNNRLKELHQNWWNSKWNNSEQSTYTYDGNNNMISYLYQNWSGSEWIDIFQTSWIYDENNNAISVSVSKSGSMNNLFLYLYYNNMQSSLSWYNSFVTVTASYIKVNNPNAIDEHFADLKNKLRNHNGLNVKRKRNLLMGF